MMTTPIILPLKTFIRGSGSLMDKKKKIFKDTSKCNKQYNVCG